MPKSTTLRDLRAKLNDMRNRCSAANSNNHNTPDGSSSSTESGAPLSKSAPPEVCVSEERNTDNGREKETAPEAAKVEEKQEVPEAIKIEEKGEVPKVVQVEEKEKAPGTAKVAQCAHTSNGPAAAPKKMDPVLVPGNNKAQPKKCPAEDNKENDKRKPRAQPAPTRRTIYSTSNTSLASRQKRTITVSGVTYDVLGTLGHGGSSKVYHVVNEIGRVFAVKTVDLTDADEITRQSYINEIGLLSKLQGSPHVITLYAYELQGDQLHVVMEKGDGDLQAYLRNRRSDEQSVKNYTIKFLWGEMLRCVKVIHDKNIVHSDLKPANFLFVGGGHIKLIDFGIAASIPSDQTSVWKEGMMGTLSYMSPEAINECGNSNVTEDLDDSSPRSRYKVPLKSDVWSLGCILYNMVYARTPFQGVKSMQDKMAAIVNHKFVIDFPEIDDKRLLDVMKRCLVRDVNKRASVEELLHHPYLEERIDAGGDHANMDRMLNILQSIDLTPRTKVRQMEKLVSSTKLNISNQ